MKIFFKIKFNYHIPVIQWFPHWNDILVCVCVACACTNEDQRTTWSSWIIPSATWFSGIELISLGLATGDLICWANLPALTTTAIANFVFLITESFGRQILGTISFYSQKDWRNEKKGGKNQESSMPILGYMINKQQSHM